MKIYSARGLNVDIKTPAVMAIVNATPDSFSDGGQVDEDEKLNERLKQIIDTGADVIDVGGESTRPGHESVTAEEESKRVVRVVSAIRNIDEQILISVDTQKAQVAEAAINAGADFINDISSLNDKNMASLVKRTNCSLVVMRNQALSQPVIESCKKYIEKLSDNVVASGIAKEKIIIDPGLGFGNLVNGDFTSLPGADVTANLELINGIEQYCEGFPVLIGASRKRFIGILTGVEESSQRLAGSVAVAFMAMQNGASIVRAHDVAATIKVRDIILSCKKEENYE